MPRGVKGQNGLRFEMLTSAQRPGCQLLLRRFESTRQIPFPLRKTAGGKRLLERVCDKHVPLFGVLRLSLIDGDQVNFSYLLQPAVRPL